MHGKVVHVYKIVNNKFTVKIKFLVLKVKITINIIVPWQNLYNEQLVLQCTIKHHSNLYKSNYFTEM